MILLVMPVMFFNMNTGNGESGPVTKTRLS